MTAAPDLLVISDLHLGDDHVAGDRVEQELAAFLDHHRADGRRYRLVVNGDMLDLVGMTVMPGEAETLVGLHQDDHRYGLGGRPHAAVHKLGAVLARHVVVFRALGRFLAAGHEVAIVIGNHDAELHWPEAQALLRDTLARLAREQGGSDVTSAISFHPWFFFEHGVAWIEHGHQYDPYCSFEDVLEPATDEVELDPSLSALLVRYVGPAFGEPIHDAWGMGFFGFLRFWGRQGRDRLVAIPTAYFDVFLRMAEHWRRRVPERLAARRARARARLLALTRRAGLPVEVVAEVMALGLPPVGVALPRIVRALMLDRLLLLVFGPLLALVPLVLAPSAWWAYTQSAMVAALAGWLWFALLAREPVDPTETMRAAARRIRERLRVPIVVMGHSHAPLADADGQGGYFNTGTWVVEHARAFTHLRIERTERGVRARLCQWRDGASRVLEPAAETG